MKNKKQRGYNLQLDSPIGNFAKGKMSAPEFDFMGRGAAWWLWKAEELHRMATLGVQAHYADCEERRPFFAKRDFTGYVLKPSTLKVAFFLAALAIENLLKGSLVKEHPEYIKDGKFRGEIISSHNLIKIARDANISLDAGEASFCELGTEAISTFGRYPVAKNVTDDSLAAVQPTFFEIYDRLRGKLEQLIMTKPSKKKK